jgi:hypothetical protein
VKLEALSHDNQLAFLEHEIKTVQLEDDAQRIFPRDPKPQRIHALLSLAESVKSARDHRRCETDERNARLLGSVVAT